MGIMVINGRKVIARDSSDWNWFEGIGPNYNREAVTNREWIAGAIRTVIRSYPQPSQYVVKNGEGRLTQDRNEYAIGRFFVVTEFRISAEDNESGDNVFISIQYNPAQNTYTSSMGGHFDPELNRMVWSIYAD